jgi:hypothetical protein
MRARYRRPRAEATLGVLLLPLPADAEGDRP